MPEVTCSCKSEYTGKLAGSVVVAFKDSACAAQNNNCGQCIANDGCGYCGASVAPENACAEGGVVPHNHAFFPASCAADQWSTSVCLCAENQYVTAGNACADCASGKTAAAGADPTGAATVCAVPCSAVSDSTGEGSVEAGCTCAAAFSLQGGIAVSINGAATEAPWHSGACVVACPAHATGDSVTAGCTCDAGYSLLADAAIARVAIGVDADLYTGECVVPCPANSAGASIAAGCTCNDGYALADGVPISAAHPVDGELTVTGSCAREVQCPARSVGASVSSGCDCTAGLLGNIVASDTDPFYTGSCGRQCPEHSVSANKQTIAGVEYFMAADGTDGDGCACKAGYTGDATTGACTAVACPAIVSTGTTVIAGCECTAGYSGSVVPASIAATCGDGNDGADVPAPCALNAGADGCAVTSGTCVFVAAARFTSTCAPVACPSGATGTDVPTADCACSAGTTPTDIAPTTSAPFYSGGCATVDCPTNSAGTDVATGDCACAAGYEGDVAATSSTPYYIATCAAKACPLHSDGTSVPAGCACDAGYFGAIVAAAGSPYYTGSCERAAKIEATVRAQAGRRRPT